MPAVKVQKLLKCRHTDLEAADGLVLIALTPGKQRNDAAASLCNALPANALKGVCRFDLEHYDGLLCQCLSGHKAAILVESTESSTATGTISICDLGALTEQAKYQNFDSADGNSLYDQIRQARRSGKLPGRIILFSVGTPALSGLEELSGRNSMPALVRPLTILVSTVLEAVKQDS